MALKIEVSINEWCAVLNLTGRITLGEGSVQLRDAAKDLIKSGHPRLVIDMSRVDYIDSSGLGTLYVQVWPWTHNAGGEFVLVDLTPKVQDLLQITKLGTMTTIFPSTAEAIQYFHGKIVGGGSVERND
jgi:anti-sigma B factor antagonist